MKTLKGAIAGQTLAKGRTVVKVQPGASKDALLGKQAGEWKLSITAPAVGGRANRAAIDLLARLLRLRRAAIGIVQGQTSRLKVIEVEGVSSQELEQRLEAAAKR